MSTRPCPRCGGTGAIAIPTAHRQRPVWQLCPACNPELLDEAGEWRASDPEPRAPTPAEVAAFARGPRRERWRELPEEWTCPGCGRTKVEILRWVRRLGGRWGWTVGLALHHDHGAPCGSSRAELLAWGPKEGHPAPRFPPTVICAACNAADGVAKRGLGLPDLFSFAPEEIRLFVRATAHGALQVDLDAAWRVWEEHWGAH